MAAFNFKSLECSLGRFLAVSLICALSGPLSHGSPVAVFFVDRGHPCLWNFNSTVSIDVIRVYVNCLFDLTCVVMKITINKLNFVPVDWLMSGVVVLLWNGEVIRDMSSCRLKFLVVRALSGLLTISCVLFLAFAYFIMYREAHASAREDKNTTNVPGRSRKIYQREQGTWDNCLCSWGC